MKRFRRLRTSEPMRRLVRETKIAAEEMIYPIFVIEGENIKNPIDSMPGIYQYSLDRMNGILKETAESGVSGILIFGIPAHKDEYGSQAYAPDGITQRAVRQIKRDYPNLLVIADVCLCEYTSHGHCGLVEEGKILNDETLPLLAKMSVSLAEAGADIIAPSDMMDGRVAAIRQALDENGFPDVPIMAYSAKFASAYYGPFREAAHSCPFRALLWRQAFLPDGLPQQKRSLAGNRRRYCRRGGYRHGKACSGVSGCGAGGIGTL